MSRKVAIVEDEFDDDTELPLPSRSIPNTGTRGALLEEIDSDNETDFDLVQRAGPGSSALEQSFRTQIPSQNKAPTVTDLTPYKSWTCIYPIYLDAKRAYKTGERRIERPKALWWPLSKDIADASSRLGLGTLHEINKTHPRDWENPGRVRTQWKKDGKLVNPSIKSKKQLLEAIAAYIQLVKPDNSPQKPYALATPKPSTAPARSKPPPLLSNVAGKSKQFTVLKSSKPRTREPKLPGRRLAVPPEPHPPLSERLSTYSPIISTGMLVDTVTAGMAAQESNPPISGVPQVSGAGGKGKRKVVRVRQ